MGGFQLHERGQSALAYLKGALDMSRVVNLNPHGRLKKWLEHAVDSVNPSISCSENRASCQYVGGDANWPVAHSLERVKCAYTHACLMCGVQDHAKKGHGQITRRLREALRYLWAAFSRTPISSQRANTNKACVSGG